MLNQSQESLVRAKRVTVIAQKCKEWKEWGFRGLTDSFSRFILIRLSKAQTLNMFLNVSFRLYVYFSETPPFR